MATSATFEPMLEAQKGLVSGVCKRGLGFRGKGLRVDDRASQKLRVRFQALGSGLGDRRLRTSPMYGVRLRAHTLAGRRPEHLSRDDDKRKDKPAENSNHTHQQEWATITKEPEN